MTVVTGQCSSQRQESQEGQRCRVKELVHFGCIELELPVQIQVERWDLDIALGLIS